jgi:hypothetical protein
MVASGFFMSLGSGKKTRHAVPLWAFLDLSRKEERRADADADADID